MSVLKNNTTRLQELLAEVSNLPEDSSEEAYEKGYSDGHAEAKAEIDEEVSLQKELLAQATQEIAEKADPELYDKGYAAGIDEKDSEIAVILSKTIQNIVNDKAVLLGANIFASNPSLRTASFPNVTLVRPYAFQDCTNLYLLDLPSVKEFAMRSLMNTKKLVTLDLKVCTILPTAWAISSGLTTLILRSETMCTLAGSDSFNGTPIASGTGFIYVPDNLVDSYKAATNWATHANQIKPLSELEE